MKKLLMHFFIAILKKKETEEKKEASKRTRWKEETRDQKWRKLRRFQKEENEKTAEDVSRAGRVQEMEEEDLSCQPVVRARGTGCHQSALVRID